MELAATLQLKPGQHLEGVRVPQSASPALVELEAVGERQQDAALLVFVADRSTLEDYRAHIVEAASRGRLTWVAYPKAGQLGTISTVTR